jgi:TonB-dependent starch-binding outer membrane protein SusC
MRKKLLLSFCAMLLFNIAVWAQTTATGKVVDEKGNGVAGASVLEKGTRNGTLTASDGSFSLKVKAGAKLVISEVGYENAEVAAGTGVSVKLKTDTKALSEVVVTGTGVAVSKRRLGTDVASITADKLPQAPTASIDQALVGKIAGAQISSVSGNPGDPVNIVLRGINSLGGTQPLFIVDGVQIGGTDLGSLDLSNIERVEVVQGAAGSALYGAQGANGVIQVFTKKGKKGNAQISFSTSYAANSFLNVGDVQKSRFHPYRTDASGNILDNATGLPVVQNADGTMPRISYRFGAPLLGAGPSARLALLGPQNRNDQPYNANLKFYDHFAQIFQTGYTFNNNLSISGAGDKSDYNISFANSVTESPIIKAGKLNRSNISINVGTELAKNLKLRSTTQLVYTKNTITPQLGAPGGLYYGLGNRTNAQNFGGGTGVYGFLNTSPFFDLTYRQPDGTPPNYFNAVFLSVNTGNPFYNKYYSEGLSNKIDIVQSLNLSYQVNKWIDLDAKYGINYRTENARHTYFNQADNVSTSTYGTYVGWYAPDENGEIINYQYNNTYQNLLLSGTIKTDFERDFKLKIPVKSTTYMGYDYRKQMYKEYDTYGVGLPTQPPINISTTGSQTVALDYVEPFTTYGYFLNQRFEIGEWGGIAGGFRTDWSSNFGDGLSFTFGNINGYLNLSNFDFWKNSNFSKTLNFFKLRSAYGEAGIQPPFGARYPGIDPATLGNSLSYTLQSSAKNPGIKVEKTSEFELGAEFGINLAKGKWFSALNGSITYWNRKSKDVIAAVSAPPTTGASEVLDNVIDMSSRGVNFQLNIPVYKSKEFSWDLTTNFGTARSYIDKITGIVQQFTGAAGSVQLKLIEGQTVGQIFGYKALTSVDAVRSDGSSYISAANKGKYTIAEGKVVDTATKGIFFADEATFIGDPNPKFNMSFINSFTYKDWLSVGFQLDWVAGSHLYNQTKEWMYRDGIHGDFDKSVTINGVTAPFTSYWGSAYYGLGATPSGPGNNATKDFFYEEASFLRLRNINVGVDFAKIVKTGVFKKMQLVLSGRNLFTITKYTGFDPEINSGPANSSFERGIDHSSLPNMKSYQVSLNVNF